MHVLLLNDDCRIQSDCLKQLRESLKENVAAIGPLSNDNGLQSLTREARLKQSRQNGVARITDEKVLAFFCTLVNSEAISQIGVLDEDYQSGLMADNEWCERAVRAGWKVQVHGGAFDEHDHSQTFQRLGMDRKALHIEAIQHHG